VTAELRKNARFAWALFTTNLKSVTALRGSFLLSMTFMALNNATFLVFWWVLFGRIGQLRGWQGGEVLLLFGISAAGFGLMAALAGGALHLSRFIDEGALEPLLTQPKPTLLYVLGCRSQASGFGDFVSGIAFIALSGYLSWSKVPLVLCAVLASALVFTATCVLLFSLAFWLHRTHTLSRQLLDITITFSLYPDPLFSGGLRLALFTVVPAGFVGYLPAALVRHASLADAALLAAGSLGYVWLAIRVFRSGLARYSSGSRFGVFG
jgi:ABC-2 type transport system permease protein